jgi:hypothetical protein
VIQVLGDQVVSDRSDWSSACAIGASRAIRPRCYGLPRKPSRMISIRDGVDRLSVAADLASASAQSTHPLLRIRQVLLSMVLSRQRLPAGETTSMEPVLRSASLDTCGRGTGPESWDLFVTKAKATQSVRNPKAKNARGRSARNRPIADGFCARKVPVARMLPQFVAAVHRAELPDRLACRAMMSENHCAFVSEDGKRPHL